MKRYRETFEREFLFSMQTVTMCTVAQNRQDLQRASVFERSDRKSSGLTRVGPVGDSSKHCARLTREKNRTTAVKRL